MACPQYVYPWWGRNMANDPKKAYTLTGKQETRSLNIETNQRKERGKDKRSK